MSDVNSTSSFWSRTWLQLVIVFAAAFLMRAFFVVHYGPILTNDSTYYLGVADGIREGKGLGLPYRSPPLYPLFLAVIHSVGSSHWVIIWVQAVVGALTCVVLEATCQRLIKPKLAFVLGLAVALYIPMAAFCVTVLRETIIGLGISLVTYCLVRSLLEQRLRWCWATGAAGAFTLFNQATFVFFPFWVGLVYWIHARSWKNAFMRILPIVACYAVAVGSWTARNYHVTGHLIPLSADHIGYFLLEGIMDANKEAKALTPGQIRRLGIVEDDPYNTYAGMRDQYWGLGNAEGLGGLERKLKDGPVLFSRAVRLVLHEPGKYLRFSLQRLHRLWFKDLWAERTEESYLNLRPLDEWRATHNVGALIVVVVIYAFGYSSLVGMVVYRKPLLGLLVPVVTMLSFHAWVHAETRYALAIHPYLLIFSLLAAIFVWQRLIQRKPTTEIRAAVLK